MYFKSKKTPLLLLAITALVSSRVMFSVFNDPEGPNLLIVIVTAVVVYALSLTAYATKLPGSKKLVLAIFLQILVIVVSYLCLN